MALEHLLGAYRKVRAMRGSKKKTIDTSWRVEKRAKLTKPDSMRLIFDLNFGWKMLASGKTGQTFSVSN